MANGVSTDLDVSAIAADLQAQGIVFVFRYYSTTTAKPQKRLTLNEAEALAAANLLTGAVYEDAPTGLSYFSNSRGHQDGVNAYNAAQAVNQPPGSAIYFTVDYDAPASDIAGSILDYFNGVNRGLQDAANGNVGYVIGTYGSGSVCSFLKLNCPFVQYSWLAESTGWSGSETYTGYDVVQQIASQDLCGLVATGDPNTDEYEDNTANEDFGGFMPGHSS
jgi:hypothetical protein